MLSLIPNSYSQNEHDIDAVSEAMRIKIAEMIWNSPLLDPMRCSERFLPSLAKFYAVGFWDETLPELDRRRLIQASIVIKRHRGTVGAVMNGVKSIGLTPEITEWYQTDDMDVHTFKIVIKVPDEGYDMRKLDLVEHVVFNAKPARSHLVSVGASMTGVGNVPFVGGVVTGYEKTIISMEAA